MGVFYTLHIKEAGHILHICKDICGFTLNHPPEQKQVENKKPITKPQGSVGLLWPQSKRRERVFRREHMKGNEKGGCLLFFLAYLAANTLIMQAYEILLALLLLFHLTGEETKVDRRNGACPKWKGLSKGRGIDSKPRWLTPKIWSSKVIHSCPLGCRQAVALMDTRKI